MLRCNVLLLASAALWAVLASGCSGGAETAQEQPTPQSQADVPGGDPHAGIPGFGDSNDRTGAPATEIDLTGVVKPEGGHTVAEICGGAADLAGKEVVFRGRVVKYNSAIMGMNWLHVQDGTGDPASGSNDITVTTNASAKVGDLVTVRGVVAVDKDLGAGYHYDVIVEDASVEVATES